ncbi:protein PHYLLO, chloroplastic isoform X1 [Brassica rapa]|uniref:Mandelate racemase/muconate lactonizing enzyme C-terminal domain-containing protein n=1 Tax=Brassica campestris TaxID=3711 RepID=M4FB74_BRACM|nr:protein PHYLLO, chloroplastic isoform X1 [Brassica rapa]
MASPPCYSFLLLSNPPFLPSLIPRYASRYSFTRRTQRFSSFASSLHGIRRNIEVAQGAQFDELVLSRDDVSEDDELTVQVCVTRTLPPALTLEVGLERVMEAVDELKSNPPKSSSGVLRFQVAVPPRAKALFWFCSQPVSSGVFPVFFLSKDTVEPSYKSLYVKEPHGVFGIGDALSFLHHSKGHSSIKTFLSDESAMVTAYGFPDIDFNGNSSVYSKDGSSYFFVPQVELDEHEEVSILAVTLAWNDSLSYSFEQAISSYEKSIFQVSCHVCPNLEEHWFKNLKSSLAKLDVKEIHPIKMEHMEYLTFSGRDQGDAKELKNIQPLCQFHCKLSPDVVFSNNMLNQEAEVSNSLKDQANINAVWASAIIEECTRLGLTYFCVAPGSRSSHLAIAAANHPLTTCLACYDERSLAFHAIGYAKGSLKPAVIITSSGTAVSNLLPAVVEASEDFLPLLLLTADRPPELQGVGANQAINQINHFGSFVRFFFNLPPPTDLIPVRMVLTTIDSALHWATGSACGPVHMNCPFRDPLDGSPTNWSFNCLNGLDMWMSNSEPFTKYFQVQSLKSNGETTGQITEVLQVIKEAKKGLLLIGAIHTEDEIWASLLLAKELMWPVVADVLSGVRLRKLSKPFLEKWTPIFVDHLDHALLSDSVKNLIEFDVVIQVGSRITSKRVSQVLEKCFPFAYILVDKHPCRHDPSHLVTHRVQSNIVQFADCVLKSRFPWRRSKLHGHLHALDGAIAREMSFQLSAECSLTEPYVAHMLSKALTSKSALFIGNSMPIRDVDMYGCSSGNYSHVVDMMLSAELPSQWIQVTGNRGASGIDGLLSSATGFAVGCKKRVVCVVGDVSFLHDTNGLAILKQRTARKAMTVLVINNRGGGIFRLLPIAKRTEPSVLNQYFYTSHDISIENLCLAHGVKYVHVGTKRELEETLLEPSVEEMDCIVEVESSIDANAIVHSTLESFARQAANNSLGIISASSVLHPMIDSVLLFQVSGIQYSRYRVGLCDRPTIYSGESSQFHREGFILSLTLEDGSIGCGEVAPLDSSRENLMDVEGQLQLILHLMKGAKVSHMLPLLNGSFSSWIWSELGITASSVFPSVRCGLEMALLNAMAVKHDSGLMGILHCQKEENGSAQPHSVPICALLDSEGTPSEVAYVARKLVEEGFSAIKLKVARRVNSVQDALVLQEVRRLVGDQIELRVDANCRWTFEEAITFGLLVKKCNLQYIEEPVQNKDDLIRFCEESGLPVALDETLDDFKECPLRMLAKYTHPGVVAVVIKPSVVGGFEIAALIARWAQQHGKMAVISAAYESGLGLSAYILFASYLETENVKTFRERKQGMAPLVAHGLGTYKWLNEDVMMNSLGISRSPYSGFIEGSVADASKNLKDVNINNDVIVRTSIGVLVRRCELRVDVGGFSHFVRIHEVGQNVEGSVVMFLHGFLGTGEEWIPIMKGISGSARCISVDIPGHGSSRVQSNASETPTFSMEMIAEALYKLIEQITPGKVTIVGYSMGARIALYMALRFSNKIEGAVVVSGSPGIKDPVARKVRSATDDSKARMMVDHGLEIFVENWYNGGLWKSFRSHPHFRKIVASRLVHDDVLSVAKCLSDLSTGRQPSLWEELADCDTNVSLVFGEKDVKFKKIASRMYLEMSKSKKSEIHIIETVEIPEAGHAVHLESPLHLILALRKFLTRVRKNSAETELSQKLLLALKET